MRSKNFTSAEVWTGIVLLSAIMLKIMVQLYHLQIEGDRAFQVATALNLAKGHGYTMPETSLPFLNIVEYRWVVEWPPLYSVLLVPFLWISGMDQVVSIMLLESIGLVLFLVGIVKLLRSVGFPLHVVLIILLFQSSVDIFLYATDFPAATCVIWAMYFFCKADSEKMLRNLYLSSILLIAAIYFRFMYAPLLGIIPLYLLVWSGQEKNLRLLKHAGWIMLISVLLGSAGFVANKLIAGEVSYLYAIPPGFNLLRILTMAPIFWHAFAHVLFVTVQLSTLLHVEYTVVFNFFVISSLVFLLVLTGFMIRFIIKMKKITRLEGYDRFILFGSVASALIVLSLSWLSVTLDYSAIHLPGDNWTFVNEHRYFIFPVFFILVVVTESIFSNRLKWRTWVIFVGKVLIISALFIKLSHTLWILHKFERMPSAREIKMPPESYMRRCILKSLNNAAQKNGFDMVALTADYGIAYYCLENNIKIFRKIFQLDGNTSIIVNQPTIFVIAVEENETDRLYAFMKRYGFVKLIDVENRRSYYFTVLKPTQ
jgi:hypothetical protein